MNESNDEELVEKIATKYGKMHSSRAADLNICDHCEFVEALREAIRVTRERCAAVALEEKVDATATGSSDDEAYNLACDHISEAILRMQQKGTK